MMMEILTAIVAYFVVIFGICIAGIIVWFLLIGGAFIMYKLLFPKEKI